MKSQEQIKDQIKLLQESTSPRTDQASDLLQALQWVVDENVMSPIDYNHL